LFSFFFVFYFSFSYVPWNTALPKGKAVEHRASEGKDSQRAWLKALFVPFGKKDLQPFPFPPGKGSKARRNGKGSVGMSGQPRRINYENI
jgi:hypothetical protein